MADTHEVLDLVYTPDEGQECFSGSLDECNEFVQKQGGVTFMYKVVPKVTKSSSQPVTKINEAVNISQ